MDLTFAEPLYSEIGSMFSVVTKVRTRLGKVAFGPKMPRCPTLGE